MHPALIFGRAKHILKFGFFFWTPLNCGPPVCIKDGVVFWSRPQGEVRCVGGEFQAWHSICVSMAISLRSHSIIRPSSILNMLFKSPHFPVSQITPFDPHPKFDWTAWPLFISDQSRSFDGEGGRGICKHSEFKESPHCKPTWAVGQSHDNLKEEFRKRVMVDNPLPWKKVKCGPICCYRHPLGI